MDLGDQSGVGFCLAACRIASTMTRQNVYECVVAAGWQSSANIALLDAVIRTILTPVVAVSVVALVPMFDCVALGRHRNAGMLSVNIFALGKVFEHLTQ